MPSTNDFDLASIAPFFMASSLAVIGASTDPRKFGGKPILWSKLGGFKGKIYPINSAVSEVHGIRAYASLQDVEAEIECAFIALPAPAVEEAVRACAQKGVRAVIIISSNFAEAGAEGRKLQDRIVEIARNASMRVLGPNCMGAMNVDRAFYPLFYSVFEETRKKAPKAGGLSLVSQSGAFGAHVFELALARGLGFSKWVTTGNQCDVQVADFIAYLAEDRDTKAIMVYMEGSPEPARLISALKRAQENGKPVVLLKAGRSEVGQHAAFSHTGALTGSDKAFDAMCLATGVRRAHTIAELLDVGAACAHGKTLTVRKVGLVTISGGVGALMADYAEELGLAVPALPASAQEALRRIFPAGSARNPVDPTALWAQDATVISKSVRTLFLEGGHEAVVVFLSTAGVSPTVEPKVREQIIALQNEFPDRLVLVSMIAPDDVLADWRSAGLLVYEDPQRALQVLASLAMFASAEETGAEDVGHQAREPLAHADAGARRLTEIEASDLLERAGIPFAPRAFARSSADAERAAQDLGFPVVLKLVSPDIAHKSEVGGVVTNLSSQMDVKNAYELIVKRAKKAAPLADLQGALVARQIVGGVETILGISRDPGVGTVVLFGIGGIFVEIYKDVALRLAPVSVHEAHAMIREVRGHAILNGARGGTPMDLGALAEAISKLSEFAVANEATLRSIDINPFIVMPKGQGAFGVDALIEAI